MPRHLKEEVTETLELSTYYPAPYGEYDELSANKVSVGTYPLPTCDGTMLIEGNLGIGTTGPGSLLDVNGTAQLRGSAAGTGLYVDSTGKVGIGTATPQAKLEVVGRISQTGLGNSTIIGENAGVCDDLSKHCNVFIGTWAAHENTSGCHNTAVGVNALGYVTTGSENVAVGTSAGLWFPGFVTTATNINRTGSKSVFIGADTGAGATDRENQIVIGYNAIGLGSNSVVLGNNNITKTALRGKVGIGTRDPAYQLQLSTDSAGKPNGGAWANSSDMRVKKNIKDIANPLELILRLRGRQFEWINPEEHGNLQTPRFGFIAQETKTVFPEWFSEVEPQGKDKELVKEGKIDSIGIFGFEALAVEAIRQLKSEVDNLKELNTQLKVRLEKLEATKQ